MVHDMKKKHLYLAFALVGAVAGVVGFVNLRNRQSIVLAGAVLPLTGDLAFFGNPEKFALQMAIQDLEKTNVLKKGQLYFEIEDSRSSPKDGITALRKLLVTPPDAVITSLTMVSLPAIPILQEKAIPQIALSVHPNIQNKSTNIFRLYYGFEDEMSALADYAKRKGVKTVAIAWINTPELEASINDVLRPKLKEKGIALVGSSSHTFGTTDFRSIMIDLASKKPDLLILQDFGPLLPAMVEAANNQGLKKLVGGIGFMSSPEAERFKLSGIPFVLPKFLIDNTSSYEDFNQRFKDFSGGGTATYDVVFTYDAASIFGKAAAQARQKRVSLSKTLSEMSRFKGISGDLTIKNRALQVPLGWGEFNQQGALQPIKKSVEVINEK